MKEKSFGIIPIFKKGKNSEYLIIRHKYGKHWSFPKGHAEKGESYIEAAHRELREETGISVSLVNDKIFFEEKYSFIRSDKKVDKTVRYYVGVVSSKKVTIQRDELSDYCWADYNKAMNLLTFDEAKNILSKVEQIGDSHFGDTH